VTVRLGDRGIRAVLLDIEGTTTPIAFVHEVLFPYAAARLDSFLADSRFDALLAGVRRQLAAEHAADVAAGTNPPPWKPDTPAAARESTAAYVRWLMARDRKSPGLKELQGQIWEVGYQGGELRGQVFADVAPAIARWRRAGIDVAIYSSGSQLAQRRLFESTADGDLSSALAGFFDTRVGAKMDASSYLNIARALEREPAEILFLSDVSRELEAAREAGLQVALVIRPGNPLQPDAERFEQIGSFAEIG
jgi:enolase-phosphatase E1